MNVFKEIDRRGHEQVCYFSDPSTDLKLIIAIHNTVLGPALGGCRMRSYKSEKEALVDVLRLSKGMTYKAAIAGLNLGGGKAVIIGDPDKDKTESLFRSFGRFVQGLGGRYITAEDVGTTVKDMEFVRMETNHVTGISESLGGSGDPSPVTAYGVYIGMQACVKYLLNKNSLSDLSILVQGLGKVGMELVEYLNKSGSQIYVSDIDKSRELYAKEKFNASIAPENIYDLEVDIFSPNALGAVINDNNIENLKCKIVAGGANNVLGDSSQGAKLKSMGILYAPDYAINAGGLINVSNELEGYNRDRAFKQAEGIYDTLISIFERSDSDGIPTNIASDKQAVDRINRIGGLKTFHLPTKKRTSIGNS